MSKVYPFWVVDLVTRHANGGTSRAYIKLTLNTAAIEDPKQIVEVTDKLSEAERFGRDYGKRIADLRGGKLVKVTGAKKAAPKPVLRTNHIAVVLDGSGSMSSVREATVRAFNSIMANVRENAKKFNQRTTVSMWTLGVNAWTQIREDFYYRDIEEVKDLTLSTYVPYGNTPLLDAIGTCIDRLRTIPNTNDPNTSYLVYVITDGEENASNKYSNAQIKTMIDACQSTDRWTFAFMMPPGKKYAFCAHFGIPDGNCREWEATELGVQQLAFAINTSNNSYYTSRSVGMSATRGFFTTDLSGVKPTEIRRKLTDVQDKLKSLRVDREADIKTFIEEKTGQSYRKGDAFFPLTKDEKVQAFKKILVREKGKTAVYAGQEARELLGLPKSDAKLRPGNHSNYDLYVQSVSTNRKLVRGTEVLYVKPGESV